MQDNYRIYLDIPVLGRTLFQNTGEAIKFQWKKYKDEIFKRHEMVSKLCFNNIEKTGVYDYALLRRLDNSPNRCKRVPIIIEDCNCGEWSECWTGYICMNEGDFNDSNCSVSFEATVTDQYTCWIDKQEEVFNILDCPKVKVDTVLGEYETVVCSQQNVGWQSGDPFQEINNCLVGVGWVVNWTGVTITQMGGTGGTTTNFITKWIREVLPAGVIPPIGEGYSFDPTVNSGAGGYVRPVSVSLVPGKVPTDFTGVFPVDFPPNCYIATVNDQEIDNGVRIQRVVEKCLEKCDLTIKSNILNMNPDGSAPDNRPYQCAVRDIHNAIIFAISDMKRADMPGNMDATNIDPNGNIVDEMTCQKFFEMLRVTYDIYFTINQNGQMCLEHKSYFESLERGVSISLLDPKYKECVKGKEKFSYNPNDLSKSITYNFMYDQSSQFNSKGQYFTVDCNNGREDDFVADCFATDLEYLAGNKDDITNDGWIIVGTSPIQGGLLINMDTVICSGELALNGGYAWSNLEYCYHTYCRPSTVGQLNGEPFVFDSACQSKTLETIKINMTACDYKSFDCEQFVSSFCGNVSVETATFRTAVCELELVLVTSPPPCALVLELCNYKSEVETIEDLMVQFDGLSSQDLNETDFINWANSLFYTVGSVTIDQIAPNRYQISILCTDLPVSGLSNVFGEVQFVKDCEGC